MKLSFPLHNQSCYLKTLIPTRDKLLRLSLIWTASFFLALLLFIVCPSLFVPCSRKREIRFAKAKVSGVEEMKVHPVPKKRNNITIRNTESNMRNPLSAGPHKKLLRLPHIFNRVLELPFRSDADVSVEEGPDFFRFVAETDVIAGGFIAQMVEIYPGVTKIVVRPNGYLGIANLDDLELDMWRFRLPESTRPDLASAVFEDGELVVTVPKGDDDNVNVGEIMGGMDRNNNMLVLVQ